MGRPNSHREKHISPVQLATSRIDNHTGLMPSLLEIIMAIHASPGWCEYSDVWMRLYLNIYEHFPLNTPLDYVRDVAEP